MGLATFIPSARGLLALAAVVVNALVIPALVPPHSDPRLSALQYCIAICLGGLTAGVCFRAFQKRHAADWVASALSVSFACWMFYVLIERVF